MKKLEAMTLYKAKISGIYKPYADFYKDLGIVDGREYLCLGEITNMPGHYAFVVSGGRVVYGVHDDMFENIDP